MFRRADAIETWLSDAGEASAVMGHQSQAAGSSSPAINLVTASLESPPGPGFT